MTVSLYVCVFKYSLMSALCIVPLLQIYPCKGWWTFYRMHVAPARLLYTRRARLAAPREFIYNGGARHVAPTRLLYKRRVRFAAPGKRKITVGAACGARRVTVHTPDALCGARLVAA